MTWGEVALVALAGGLLALDRVAVGQFALSQPVVAGPLVGWLLGDAAAGFAVGGALQLLYAGSLPVGDSVPPDEAAAAVVGAAAAVVGARIAEVPPTHLATLALALVAGLAAGEAGRGLDLWVRRANVWFAHRADWAAARGDDRRLARLALGGLGLWPATGAAVAALAAPAAAFVVGWAARGLSGRGLAALHLLGLALAVSAVGAGLVAMRAPARSALFAGAFAAGAALAAAAGFGLAP
jgi:PTS system mannose-specific IIC component